MQRGSLGSLPAFWGASLFGWEFKQSKSTENRRFLEERKREKCLNVPSIPGSTAQESLPRWGSRSRQRLDSARSCWGGWTEAGPHFLCLSSSEGPWLSICASLCLLCTLGVLLWAGGWFTPPVWAQHPRADTWHCCGHGQKHHPTGKAPREHPGVGFLEGLCGTPALNQDNSMVLCACAGGRGMIKGDDDQGSYFCALSSSCCSINNANISAVTGIPVFPQLWIYSNRFSQL